MKIRNGFVSNSSSSSFIIVGQIINDVFVTPELIEDGKVYGSSWEYCGDGADFFKIDQSMFEMYGKFGTGKIEFYKVDVLLGESGEVSKEDLPDGDFKIFTMEVDYHTTQNIDDFSERYLDMPEIMDAEEIRVEAKKIAELQDQINTAGLESYQDRNGKTRLRKKDED